MHKTSRHENFSLLIYLFQFDNISHSTEYNTLTLSISNMSTEINVYILIRILQFVYTNITRMQDDIINYGFITMFLAGNCIVYLICFIFHPDIDLYRVQKAIENRWMCTGCIVKSVESRGLSAYVGLPVGVRFETFHINLGFTSMQGRSTLVRVTSLSRTYTRCVYTDLREAC